MLAEKMRTAPICPHRLTRSALFFINMKEVPQIRANKTNIAHCEALFHFSLLAKVRSFVLFHVFYFFYGKP